MYDFKPDAVYVTRWALQAPRCVARMERMVAAMGCEQPVEVDEAGLCEVIAERSWRITGRTGSLGPEVKRDMLFNAYRWDRDEIVRAIQAHPGLGGWHSLAGQGAWTFRDDAYASEHMRTICQSGWELHCAWGCLHGCRYCHVGRLVNIMLNLEELRDHLPEMFALCPGQKLFKFDNQTDTVVFEPEYGASEVFVPHFAQQDDRYLMLYTKSDNVEHLLDLPHGGRTLISWTVSPRRTCEEVEIGAPGMEARLRAARACQEAGYRVRFRFSPIMPLASWREDMADLVRSMRQIVEPDFVTIDVLGWMRPLEMTAAMDVETFDPRFTAEVYAAIEAGETKPGKHFFSHGLRREVLGFVIEEMQSMMPQVPVSLCNETFEMWEDLGPRIGMAPETYACCCGPDSVPGCRGLRA